MYSIKRNHIVEELEIEDNGKVLHLDVDISADETLARYNNAQYAIASARVASQKANNAKEISEAEEQLGTAVLNLFEVVFGKEQTQKILDFYDSKTLEMLSDIAPFIAEVIAPRIQEVQQRIMNSYKSVRKK